MSLERFVEAQEGVYTRALAELRAGRKQSHAMAQMYALQSLDEARAYLAHPLLGARLRECCQVVMAVEGKSAHQIFGSPDDLKFRSSLTLFAQAAPNVSLFDDLLMKYSGGTKDPATLELLEGPH